MAGQKKGRIIPTKAAAPTVRRNRHRFQGFHERIATLKINPINKARLEDEKQTESYFIARLAYWREMNETAPFASFAKEVAPFCDNLAQILHHQQSIVDLLVQNLEAKDALFLEPLLDLTSQLAHDLGQRFEKHYKRTITVISDIVSGHQDVQVLEWSFNALAWMFQYLSRLLLPDLRPTFDVLAPLLGKEVNKGHIARFSAEAMSFLLRKAAIRAERDESALRLIVTHIVNDWARHQREDADSEIYGYGLMNLFADCIKDLKQSQAIRPYGCIVYQKLLDESLRAESYGICVGLTTNLIHHTDAETFKGIVRIITAEAKKCDHKTSTKTLLDLCSLIDVVIEVRKGDRISQWSPVFCALNHIYSLLPEDTGSSDAGLVVARSAAVLVQTCPFDTLLPQMEQLVKKLVSPNNVCDFPQFCIYAYKINRDRFDQLLRPVLFTYLSEAGNLEDSRILFAAQVVLEDGPIGVSVETQSVSHERWSDRIAHAVESWDLTDGLVEQISAMMTLAGVLPSAHPASERLFRSWTDRIAAYLRAPGVCNYRAARLICGRALRWYLSRCQVLKTAPAFTWEQLTGVYHQFGRMTMYMDNLTLYLDITPERAVSTEYVQPVITSNLSTDSRNLRLASLRLLSKLHFRGTGHPVLNTAIRIEQTPLEHSSVRNISLLVRQFSDFFTTETRDTWLGDAMVHYLFGLLTLNMTPIWSDALQALNAVYQSGDNKTSQLLEDTVFRWLEERHKSPAANSSLTTSKDSETSQINEFQCTNFRKLDQEFSRIYMQLANASTMQKRFDDDHGSVSATPKIGVTQAIRVLKEIPLLAERRSRRLVPQFLAWASDEDSEATLTGDESPDGAIRGKQTNLDRTDKKAMLDVFGVIGNPKALYRSQDVYEALLHLLGNGDGAIQKAALKAVLRWRKPGLELYRENLNNLLDNARFREELMVFLPRNMEEKGLLQEQRAGLMEVLLPLLFGRVTARGKSAAGKMTQSARRKAVFESLGTFPSEDIVAFIDIAQGPLKAVEYRDGRFEIPEFNTQSLSLRRQVGFVRLAKDLFSSIGDKLVSRSAALVNALLYCLSRAQLNQVHEDEADVDEEMSNNEASMLKIVRQAGMHSFISMSRLFPHQEVANHLPLIWATVVKPRLGKKFPVHNAQSVSSLLRLLSTWALDADTAKFLLHEDELLLSLSACLSSQTAGVEVKSQVKVFIMNDILTPFLATCLAPASAISVPGQTLDSILSGATSVLGHDHSRDVLESAVSLVLKLAPTLSDQQAEMLTRILISILSMPQNAIRSATKNEVLKILEDCSTFLGPNIELAASLWSTSSKLFLKTQGSYRLQLGRTFCLVGKALGGNYLKVATICANLNSFVNDRLEEPDIERRARAFEMITQSDFSASDDQWAPIVYNSLFFVRDEEETFIRKNASHVLRAFVEKSSSMETVSTNYPASKTLRGVLLPALRHGASERSELIRVEYLSVMEHLVKECPNWPEISDLISLNSSDEDSESFFGGVLHIQQSWRIRSLVKLARVARQDRLGSENISHFLLPLVEHFVFDRADETDAHSLAAQAITTIGALCTSMEWTQVRKTLRRYTGFIKEKPELERAVIRLISVTTESMTLASVSKSPSRLASTMPGPEALKEDVNSKLLPPLTSFLHHKDESVVSLRVPIAVAAARLLCLLPTDDFEHQLTQVVQDVCSILRSKAEESRDLSRKTLAEIAGLIGPDKFSFILKELHTKLSRGPQLHVKAYTLHSILTIANFGLGDLDYCLSDIMHVILDDLFGVTGKEKDAEGYTNKAKEIKNGKSMDTAERIAKIVTIPHLKELVSPIKDLLTRRLDARSTVRIDELFRRLSSGLQQNESVASQEVLVFCYQTVQQAQTIASSIAKNEQLLTRNEQHRLERLEIKTTNARKVPTITQVSSQQYKLARFSFDLLRVVLHRHEHLRTQANLSGFLTLIGDVLLEAQEEVQIAAIRLLSGIVKVPMKQWDVNAPVYAHTAFNIIENQPNTNTELSQAAIKLVSSILRERPNVHLKATQIAKLTNKILPDLTQPARQGVTFNFLKAVVSRKIVSNEIYEAMDSVRRLFVTYSDGSARNQARSIWLQFILGYEQAEKRFDQQINFLRQNVTYEHSEGRQSVMEAIHFLLGKLDPQHLHKASKVLFRPLTDQATGDDAATCRDMAAILLKEIFQKVDDETLQEFRRALQEDFSHGMEPRNRLAAIQIYTIMTEAVPSRLENDVPLLKGWIKSTLLETEIDKKDEWMTIYVMLQLMTKLFETFEASMTTKASSVLWDAVWRLSLFPHAWVKSASSKLLSAFLSWLENNKAENPSTKTVKSKSGLIISEFQVVGLLRSHFRTLWHGPFEWAVPNIVQNLQQIDRIAGNWPMPLNEPHADIEWQEGDVDEEDSEDDDDETEDKSSQAVQNIRQFSFARLSAIIRRQSRLTAQKAALQILGLYIQQLTAGDLSPSLRAIAAPLNHLTDSSITRITQTSDIAERGQAELVDVAHQMIAELHRKLPNGQFMKAMHLVQTEARRKRDERRNKRRIEAVADPEKASREKFKKRERGRERKKERNVIHKSKRRGW